MDYKTTVTKITETNTTDSFKIQSGLSVCRTITVREVNGRLDTQYQEHITSRKHKGKFFVVRPELIKSLRYEGWISDYDLIINKKPFTYILEGNPYEVVRLDSYDHTAYNSKGELITVGQRLDYIQGRITDKHFDLQELLKHLETCKDVTVDEKRGEKLQTIPSYNRDSDSGYYYCSFVWHPENDLYREYVKLTKNVDTYKRHDMIHKMLGNDQFLKKGKRLLV